jgi:superfamily II DNA or RNA helicase
MPDLWTASALHLPRLPAAPSEGALELHLAALEYALASPLVIRDREDVRSARHWSHLLEPFEHQVRNLITFGRRAPVVLIADDVGLGKTISAGLILSELATRGRVRRALVVAPKILLPQWREELASKFATRAEIATGRAVRTLAAGSASVVLTTYATAREHMDALRAAGFDLLILDEAHRLRNLHGTADPPRLATVMRQALADRVFTYVVMLTATPIQNRLWDLYSLVDLLCAAKGIDPTLGTPEDFARTYLDDAPSVARALKPAARDAFRRHLAELMVRTDRRGSGLVFPERRVTLQACPPGEVEEALRRLVQRLLPGMNPLTRLSLAEAVTSSPVAFAAQLATMAANGTVAEDVAAQAQTLAARSPTGTKMDVLRALLAELRAGAGAPVRAVVFARRTETVEAVAAALRADGARVGTVRGGQPAANAAAIAGFWAEPPDVEVLVSTDAGAEGINLQAGNVVVNYDLPWNPMVVEQRIGRVQRLASPHRTVAVVNLVVAGSVEERVVGRLIERLQAVADTLGDVEAILEATGAGDEADEDFEKDLRDLVVRALMGQDVAAATAALEATIERAKALYADEKAAVEENLGQLDALHRAGPRLPEFEPVVPRLAVDDLVRGALEADGAVVADDPAGGLQVARPGEVPWTAVFDEADARLTRADPPVLMAAGRPAFERLVAAWTARRGHAVRDARGRPGAAPEAVARAWFAGLGEGVAVQDVDVLEVAPRFHGRAWLRAAASVDFDRLERLVSVPVGEPARYSADGADPPARTELYLPEVAGPAAEAPAQPLADAAAEPVPDALRAAVHAAVAAEPDLARFAAFYAARRTEELARATSEAIAADVGRRFAPRFAADLHAADGVLVEAARVAVRFAAAGGGPYASELAVEGGAVVAAPAVAPCAASNVRVPIDVLEACARTGARALPHRLVRSARSGRAALPDHARTCGVTGRLLLDDEVATSAVSGVVADDALFATCAVTGVDALRTELGRCEATGAWVVPGRLARSDVSGRRVRDDQLAASPTSGKRGHASEFRRCAVTGAWIAPDETGISDVSGAPARADLLVVSAKPPHRCGLPTEAASCAVTGRRLLIDELVASAVTGARGDPDAMARSAVSGAYALPAEVVACEATGDLLLPTEAGVCARTGALLRADLLAVSDLSGLRVRASLLARCPDTGARALPDELARCEASGARVAPSALVTCSATGRRVRRSLTVDCPACGEPLLRSEAVDDDQGALGHVGHLERCAWTGARRFAHELTRCAATGVPLLREQVGSSGLGRAHEALLEALARRSPPDGDALPLVANALRLRGVAPRRVWVRRNPDGRLLAVVAEERALLGLRRFRTLAYVDAASGRAVGSVAERWRG